MVSLGYLLVRQCILFCISQVKAEVVVNIRGHLDLIHTSLKEISKSWGEGGGTNIWKWHASGFLVTNCIKKGGFLWHVKNVLFQENWFICHAFLMCHSLIKFSTNLGSVGNWVWWHMVHNLPSQWTIRILKIRLENPTENCTATW